MLYIIAKKTGSRREIKKIKAKASKKRREKNSNFPIDGSDYDYPLSSYSDRDEDIWPAGYREINGLDQIVTENIKTKEYQHNDAIYNEPTFDATIFNLSNGIKDPLPVVTVSL